MDLRAGGAARRGGTGSASGADAAAPVAVPRCRRLSPPVEARSDRLMVGTPEGEEGCRALVSLLGAYKVGLTLGEESLGKVKHNAHTLFGLPAVLLIILLGPLFTEP
ncbi:hypothetical protein ACUV84_041020 [Puccinellia chinampoensis]